MLLPEDIEVRPPRSNKFADWSGTMLDNAVIVKFIGWDNTYACYLARCKCGNEFIARRNAPQNVTCGRCVRVPRKDDPAYNLWKRRKHQMCSAWKGNFPWFKESLRNMGWKPGMPITAPPGKPLGPDSIVGAMGGKLLEYNGQWNNIAGWAKQVGITRERMRQRINQWGWPQAVQWKKGTGLLQKPADRWAIRHTGKGWQQVSNYYAPAIKNFRDACKRNGRKLSTKKAKGKQWFRVDLLENDGAQPAENNTSPNGNGGIRGLLPAPPVKQ